MGWQGLGKTGMAMTGLNAPEISKRNEAWVAKWIWLEGSVSRKSLASITGLNPSTISYIVDRMLERGTVFESGKSANKRGRKEVLLSIDAAHAYFVALSLSRAFIEVAITDHVGSILHRSSSSVERTGDSTRLLEQMFGCIEEVVDFMEPEQQARVCSIAVGVPGPFTHKGNSVAVDPTDFEGLRGVPLVTLLSERFGLPVFLEERSNACAIAELTLGKGKLYPSFVYLNVGQGIGAGIVIDHKLYRGGGHVAGEVGHMTIQADGRFCSCGSRGCWEQYASLRALPDHLEPSAYAGIHEDVGYRKIMEDALSGDRGAQNAVRVMGRYLGIGIVNLIKFFDPDTIIIGDRAAPLFDILADEIRRVVHGIHVHRYHDGEWLLPATFGADGVLVGLAMIGIFAELEQLHERSAEGALNPFAVGTLPDPRGRS